LILVAQDREQFKALVTTVINDPRFKVFTTVTMKNAVFLDVTLVVLIRTDVSEERIASVMRVTRIGELGKTLAVTSLRSVRRLLVTANVLPTSRILVTLI
jgi:hypothetical protein